MSATVLITGAGGFVGSAVVRRLVRGVERRALRLHDDVPVEHVIAMVRSGAPPARLETLERSAAWSVEECDMTGPSAFADVLARRQPRAVMHLAMDRLAYEYEDEAVRLRVMERPLDQMFTRLAGRAGARVIYTSSLWVLPCGEALDESTSPAPFNVYGRNKLRAEQRLPHLRERTGVDWINLRLFNIFGRYEAPHRLLPYLVDRLSSGQPAVLANPDAVRDFTDVDVISGAYVAALEAPAAACGATYHIGSGQAITIREFALTVADVVGHAELIRAGATGTPDGGIASHVANPQRARNVLGWSVTGDVRSDIRSAARWWLERPTVAG